jgi:hypothetical protein
MQDWRKSDVRSNAANRDDMPLLGLEHCWEKLLDEIYMRQSVDFEDPLSIFYA